MKKMERQSTVHFSIPGTLKETQPLLKCISLLELQRLQDNFADANGVSFQVTDLHGNIITMPGNELPACRLFHKSPRAEVACLGCMHSTALRIKHEKRLCHMKECPLGLPVVAAPVFIDNIHVANLWLRKPVIRQDVRVRDIDLSGFLGLDTERLRTELNTLEICREEDFQNVETVLNSLIRRITCLHRQKAALSSDSGAMENRNDELDRFKARMEELVNERTADLINTNKRLQLEVLERNLVEKQIERKSKLIDAINQVLKQTLSEQEEINLYRTFLRNAREITGSKFGFIVERQNRQWEVTALSPARNDENGAGDDRNCEPFDIHGVWQEVIDTGDAMFVTNPAGRFDWRPLPRQFPPIENMLVVPLLKKGHALGLVAMINSDEAYLPVDSDDIKALAQAFVGVLIRKRMQLTKFQSEKRLNLAMDSANQGLWDYFPQSGHLYFSPSWFTMLGYHADEFPTSLETWNTLTHPNDVSNFEIALGSTVSGDEEAFGIEIRMLGKEGHWRWACRRARS
jgi:PAS domain-containing protein